MLRYPTRKHYNPRPSVPSSGGGGGAPGGAADSIQVNNGAGGFAGVGTLNGTVFKAPIGDSGGGVGFIQENGNDRRDSFRALKLAAYAGGARTDAIVNAANIPNGSVVRIEVRVVMKQTSGVAAATGISYKLIATFCKSAGVLTLIASNLVESYNNTGDAFAATQNLNSSAGTIAHTMDLTTAKIFSVSIWVDYIIEAV